MENIKYHISETFSVESYKSVRHNFNQLCTKQNSDFFFLGTGSRIIRYPILEQTTRTKEHKISETLDQT